jgi:flagellar motor switch protein FliN/FliY
MSKIPNDVLTSFSALQRQIWQSVTDAVNASNEHQFTFSSSECTSLSTADAFPNDFDAILAIQFAFADTPEHTQLILISTGTVAEWATLTRGEEISEVDENAVSEIRSQLEAVVQGICLAISSVKGEPVVASGLSIRYQALSFPGNFQRSTELIRNEVRIASDNFNGVATWLVDGPTAEFINGHRSAEGESGNDAHNEHQEFTAPMAHYLHEHSGHSTDDLSGLDLLMDIPLEISVELGRVRMMVKEVVELGTGSVVEIQKAAGEPVDVLVNGRLVARGEVVVIEDNFGVRITEILTAQERLGRLGDAA